MLLMDLARKHFIWVKGVRDLFFKKRRSQFILSEFNFEKLLKKSQDYKFSNFSWMFLNPNIFFPIWILIVLIYQIWETSRNKQSVAKNCSDLSLHVWIDCSGDLKHFAFSLEFQKFFSITRTFFSHSRSEQFW